MRRAAAIRYNGPAFDSVMPMSRFATAFSIMVLALTATSAGALDYGGAGACKKGFLWPFVRSEGDCPTDIEKSQGAPVPANPPAQAAPAPAAPGQVAAAGQTGAVPSGSASAPAAADSGALIDLDGGYKGSSGCTKGFLWPFVRRDGDCPTDIEKSQGR